MIITSENYYNITSISRGDMIYFPYEDSVIKYRVYASWLEPYHNLETIPETFILDLLKERNLITSVSEYCSKLYGYPCKIHLEKYAWPDFHSEDYDAIKRLIVDVFNLLLHNSTQIIKLTEIKNISFL